MKQVWIIKAEYFEYDGDESATLLEMAYDNYDDAHRVYSRGDRATAGDPSVVWSLSHIRIEELVEYGEYSVDKVLEGLNEERAQ